MRTLRTSAIVSTGALLLFSAAGVRAGAVAGLDRPAWMQKDIGTVAVKGQGRQEQGLFLVSGAGAAGPTEALHYMFVPVPADIELTARLEALTSRDAGSEVGLMVRTTVDPGATAMFLSVGSKGSIAVR
jgi:hypothetical protein